MKDKLAAQHPQIGIFLLAVGNVTVRQIFRVRLGMKSVSSGVDSDKAKPAMDGVQKGLLTRRRHGRIPVVASLGEIQGRIKKHGGILFSEVGRIEDAAVFGGGDFEAMLFAESLDRLFQDAGVSVLDLDHFVFKARRLGEDEHGLFLCGE